MEVFLQRMMDSLHQKPVKLLAMLVMALAFGESMRRLLAPDAQATIALNDLKIHVNQADGESLRLVPGIGTVTVARIMKERDLRPFENSQDFEDRVPGIGPAFMMNYGSWLSFEPIAVQPERSVESAEEERYH